MLRSTTARGPSDMRGAKGSTDLDRRANQRSLRRGIKRSRYLPCNLLLQLYFGIALDNSQRDASPRFLSKKRDTVFIRLYRYSEQGMAPLQRSESRLPLFQCRSAFNESRNGKMSRFDLIVQPEETFKYTKRAKIVAHSDGVLLPCEIVPGNAESSPFKPRALEIKHFGGRFIPPQGCPLEHKLRSPNQDRSWLEWDIPLKR